MLNRLREETREIHEALESKNLAQKIIDHSINHEEYLLLLLQNFQAYRKTEKLLQKYLNFHPFLKAERIKKDLENLGVKNPDFFWDFPFECKDEIEALGIAYVVEGSAMGGMMIGKQIKYCGALHGLPEQYFYNASKENAKGWNKFQKEIRNRDFSEQETQLASQKAIETFRLFEAAFKIERSLSNQ
ncbi:biliverdin-producing heme oxygenase [Christiangramia fulva]|nr:biliverdin-producing heme oxygenase [Christiangramia fulva]